MEQKKIILVLLLMILFAAAIYQVTHLENFQLGSSTGDDVEKSKTDEPSQMKLDDIQLPRIHLSRLEEKGISYEQIGRNLFTLRGGDARKAVLIEEEKEEDDLEAEDYEEEDYDDLEEEYESTPIDAARFPEMRNVRFVGLANIKGRKVAGIIVNGYIYLGLEGDVIANRYNIRKIEDNYLEISITNTDMRQILPLEGE